MSATPTPAPSGDEFPPEQILLSRGAAWVLTSLFLLLLLLPPLLDGLPGRFRELFSYLEGKGSRQPIAERLRGYDASVAAAAFTDVPRKLTQQALVSVLSKGNDRVILGKEGWLFYRPEIQALTGYGPLQPEPHSVSRDPSLLDWEPPLEPIREFAAQLHQRSHPGGDPSRNLFWLVPVPMKPSIYPEKLTGQPANGPIGHRDRHRFLQALEAAGIRVIDLMPALWEAKQEDATEGPLYLPDDTHWTTRGMKVAVDQIVKELGPSFPVNHPAPEGWRISQQRSAPGYGDLMEKLGLLRPAWWQTSRTENLERVLLPAGLPFMVDRASPVVLLGDSFVNIFDDPGLGFGAVDAASRTHAGLGAHLAMRLGIPLDVHAVNGEGASGVRRWLARRGDLVLRSKQRILWVIAERDLLLSRSVAKANRVTWDRVTFPADPAPGTVVPGDEPPAGPIVVEAVAVEKADQADPRRANYENALYTVVYEIRKKVSGQGQAPAGPIEVAHWHFKKRALQPTSRIEPGRSYRLTLEPWGTRPGLESLNLSQIGDAPPGWWAEAAEALP